MFGPMGGSRMVPQRRWGVHGGHADPRNACGALPGPGQTSQRVEGCAIARLLTMACGTVTMITESICWPCDSFGPFRLAEQFGASTRDRDQAASHIEKLEAAYWVKAHLDDNEAARRAEAGGYSVEGHALNKGVDAPASRGMDARIEDAGLQALHSCGVGAETPEGL